MNTNLWKGERAKLYNTEMNFDDKRISLQNFNQPIIAKQADLILHKFKAHTHIEFNKGKQPKRLTAA
ncbi:hypothetical protein BT93_E2845 [Corymbia citriodora subsp. variegata]|nr:hypothetical protein BT93_E2845 [Corymbia citriodora subsp. variegata]